jgi:alpha-amylase
MAVLMQAFYWDCAAGRKSREHEWWNFVAEKGCGSLGLAGLIALWLPPVSKASDAHTSMGYDPYDYWDLGDYRPERRGTKTWYGNRAELEKR